MQQLASDLNKSKRQSNFNVVIADWDHHRDYFAGDGLQQDIFRWLSPPDPSKSHHIVCKSRHPGSAKWFIWGNTFSEWKTSKTPSALLWIHGKRPLILSSYAFLETEYTFRSGCRKKRFLVCQTSGILLLGAYHVG
jgi:hypothetical protein